MTPPRHTANPDQVRYTFTETSLGLALVAARESGRVCAVLLGDTQEELESDLGDRFRGAAISAAEPGSMEQATADVVDVIEARGRSAALETDPGGTEFQREVWEALRNIPAGETATYSEVALRVGRPGATRAVARACAANPLAVVVPCHRVVRSDGELSGYRWGIERKARLLEREALIGKA